MADELKLHGSVIFRKGGAQVSKFASAKIAVAGDAFVQGVQVIGTGAWEVLQESPELGTAGITLIKNLDNTNYVEYSVQDMGLNPCRINPEEFALVRHAGLSLYMQANTGNVTVEYIIVED